MSGGKQVTHAFARNLLALREQAGISQEELGFRADLHRTEVGELERGARVPRIDTLLKLAGALEVEPNDLFAGMAYRPPRIVSSGGFELHSEERS